MTDSIDYLFLYIGIPLLLISIILSVVIAGKREQNRLLHRQKNGLLWLRSLRVLLSHIQQHRGMTTGYLNGSKELLENIKSLQIEIQAQIQQVIAVDPWMESNTLWQGISDHWSRLSQSSLNNNIDNNLQQHNKLANNCLTLIDDMAEEHGLLLLKVQNALPLHLLWRELLTAAEFIGQARAIGTGVSAARYCSSIARIRLNYLCQKITGKMQEVWGKIPPNTQQQTKVESLLKCINEQITQEHPSIKPATFFTIATEALDSLHEQYDRMLDATRPGNNHAA